MLRSCFGEGDLELYEGKLDLDAHGWKTMPVISLREASSLANPKNDFTAGRCSCKSGCKKCLCSCRKRGAPCTSKCHSGRTCFNQIDDNVPIVSIKIQ